MTARLSTVPFGDDTLFAAERGDGVFVAVKPIAATLGLDWRAQLRRLSDDPVLSEGMVTMTIPSLGGAQETTCLRLDLVHGWLFTIDAGRVRAEVRDRVLAYKRECYAVLFRHFYGGRAEQRPAELIEPPARTDEAEGPKIRQVTECRHTFGTRAAAQLWFKLGLDTVPAMYRDGDQLAFDWSRIRHEPGTPSGA